MGRRLGRLAPPTQATSFYVYRPGPLPHVFAGVHDLDSIAAGVRKILNAS